MKKFYSLLVLFLVGCGAPSQYFMLSEPKVVDRYYSKNLPIIGVEKISLPEYMQQGNLAIQLSPTQIKYFDNAKWAEDMESSLTKHLIVAIQKSFNHTSVYSYPWDLSKQAGMKIKVSINKFISYKDRVYLDANWEINDLKRGKQKSNLFSTTVATSRDSASIVASMNIAFDMLSRDILKGLRSK